MPYAVVYAAAAARDLRKPAKSAKREAGRIMDAIDAAAAELHGSNARQLQGYPHIWRVRASDYRALFVQDDKNRRLRVARVLHRSEVYRNLRAIRRFHRKRRD